MRKALKLKILEKVLFFDWLFWLLVILWGSIFIATATRLWMDRGSILLYIKDARRQKLIYLKRQKVPKRVIPRPVKEKPFGFFKLIKRVIEPYPGKKVTEAGISGTKPSISRKAYSGERIRSYKEQKRVKREGAIMRKIRKFFVESKPKPDPKLKRVIRKAPGSTVARESISKTRRELRGKGF